MKPFTFFAAAVVSISLAMPAAASLSGGWGQGSSVGGTPTVPFTAPTPRFGFGSFAPRVPRVVPTIRVTRGQWQIPAPVIPPVRTLPSVYAGTPSGTPGNGPTGQQPDPIAPVPLPASALLLLGGLGGLGLASRRRRKAA